MAPMGVFKRIFGKSTAARISSPKTQRRDCDLCGNQLREGDLATYFDQNQVLTSPSYWRHLIAERPFFKLDREDALAVQLTTFCEADPNGYYVCGKCAAKLNADEKFSREKGAKTIANSIPSGDVDKAAIYNVAGLVWESIHGSWPSCVKNRY